MSGEFIDYHEWELEEAVQKMEERLNFNRKSKTEIWKMLSKSQKESIDYEDFEPIEDYNKLPGWAKFIDKKQSLHSYNDDQYYWNKYDNEEVVAIQKRLARVKQAMEDLHILNYFFSGDYGKSELLKDLD